MRLAAVALLLILAANATAQGIYPGDAVRVNGETVSYQRFQGFYVEYRNSKGVQVGARGDQLELLTQLRKEAMDLMIEQVLVKQAAEKEGIEADPNEVDRSVEELRSVFKTEISWESRLEGEGYTEESYREHVASMMASKIYLDRIRMDATDVSDTELERYYRDNEYRLTFPEQVRVRHILLRWKPMGTQDDRGAIRKQMEPILERARNGEDFAALAAEFSEDFATKSAGGDTGLFYRGQMAPEFEDAAFALEPGEISDPVETGFGVHILKLEERLEARLVPLDEVREKLRDHVREEKMQAAVRAKIDELRAAADIEVLIAIEPPKSGG
ncbi:MAG: peptidylprolyl isomerase [Planctomycetota bacterium]|jgi:parvulin-like peptidyl-prolyl isomerase